MKGKRKLGLRKRTGRKKRGGVEWNIKKKVYFRKRAWQGCYTGVSRQTHAVRRGPKTIKEKKSLNHQKKGKEEGEKLGSTNRTTILFFR